MASERNRIRVMVLYGGRSGEHEISLISAASVIRHLNPEKYEVVPVAIDQQGRWLLTDLSALDKSAQSLKIPKNAASVVLPPYPSDLGGAQNGLIQLGIEGGHALKNVGIDVVFPVLHGPLCEDGTIQGLLELADLPYVGSGVLASSVGMDKDVAKRLARDAGLPIVPYLAVKNEKWKENFQQFAANVGQTLGYPVFVKPANLGSSVGVHKVKEANRLRAALEDALSYDTKVLIERGINAREIEFAVLESPDSAAPPLVSQPGEVVPKHEFYSYEAKYLDEEGAQLLIPARIDASDVARGQKIAREAFDALGCEGMARVDLFMDRDTGAFYFNEVNTIPGFTSISMYPKMWDYSGIPYSELLSRLIDLAFARHQRRKNLRRTYH